MVSISDCLSEGLGSIPSTIASPHSLMDRIPVYEAGDVGSIPTADFLF